MARAKQQILHSASTFRKAKEGMVSVTANISCVQVHAVPARMVRAA